ncbi:hypothetical protein BGZ94_002696 [Podila epigama]|nr:hypothetical protein BGZ94_002696 [Podila epigama]
MTVHTSDPAAKAASAIPLDLKTSTKPRTKGHPHPYLYGNFYPVFEETVEDEGIECQVMGTIPASLSNGQYVRTGPNPVNGPSDNDYHHWFDGAGMLHGVHFVADEHNKNNKTIRPRYINRFVRSEVYTKTNKHGQMTVSMGLLTGSGNALFTLLSLIWYQIKCMYYKLKNPGDGNTALTFTQSRLLALQEAGMPIEMEVPSLKTVGTYFFSERNEDKSLRPPRQKGVRPVVTAHPKIDPKTGEFIFFSWQVSFPHAVYSVISPGGKKLVWEQPIKGMKKTAMMHDFAVTPTHSIILHVPYLLDPVGNIKKGKPMLSFDNKEPTRFGIIPRYYDAEKHEVIWFESRASHIFHTANAWDETDAEGHVTAVCMTACRSERMISDVVQWQANKANADDFSGGKAEEELHTPYNLPGSGDYSAQDPDGTFLTLYRFDLKTREVQMTTLCSIATEFPVIHYDRYMQPNLRYVYGASIKESTRGVGLKIDGIVKTDVNAIIAKKQELEQMGKLKNAGGEGRWELGADALQEIEQTARQVHKFGPHMYGGEALFVPNKPRADGDGGEDLAEDDGHLLVYVYDERQLEDGVAKKEQWTELWIFDAKKIGQEIDPVAKVRIPRRIPYGFHGLWLSHEQIQENRRLNQK